MTKQNMYDQFSEDYDRFVNWEGRLAVELPFLISEISDQAKLLDRPVRVLDTACGTGQHVIALAKNRISIVGADFSGDMIKAARQNAKRAGLEEIPFYQAGFGQAASTFGNEVFDVCLCLGNSLPHVNDKNDLLNTLADFQTVLKPGGKMIIQNRNFDQVLQQQNRWMEPQTYYEDGQTWIFTRFYDFEPDAHILFNILVLKAETGKAFSQKVISTRLWGMKQDQLIMALEQTGFENFQLFGDLQGNAFDRQESGNLVVVANKALI